MLCGLPCPLSNGVFCPTAGVPPAGDADHQHMEAREHITFFKMAPPVLKMCNTWETFAADSVVILAHF